MSSARRSASGPGGLSSNALASSRKSGSSGTTPASATKRGSGSGGEEGSGLIVTRGLQEILENDRKYRKAEEPDMTEKGSKNGKARRRSSGQAPNFVICYLCGRQFGTASIDIHRPQCYLKKMIAWERGDPAIRGPKPLTPEEHAKMMKARVASATAAANAGGHPGASKLAGGAASRRANEIEMYNQIQMDAFNETSLAPCPNCGRTFLPDRLQVHLRSCKPGSTAKPIRRPSAAAASNTNANNNSSSSNGAAGAAVAASANGAASSPSAKAGPARERPIRASGAYAVPTSAGPDDVPPATGSGDDTAIRARGSYAMPEDAGADSVPPQAPSAKKPSRGPSLSNSNINSSSGNHQQQHYVSAAAAVQRGVSEDISEEAEPRETVMDVEADEVKPPSPRADTERRLSSVAILRGDPEMSGSSAPNRPASMEPSTVAVAAHSPEEDRNENSSSNVNLVYSLSQSRGREHAAGSRPRKQGSTSAPRTAQMPELVSEPREEEPEEPEIDFEEEDLASQPVVGTYERVCDVVECTTDADDDVHHHSTSVSIEKRKWTPKKIPLNNVSRFKNVESRLKQQREAELSMFVPCQYCGRTFVPERIQKHEDCCAERNKPPSRRSVQLKLRPSSAPASTTKHAKAASPPTASAASSAPHVAVPPAGHKAASPPPVAPAKAPAAASAPAPAPVVGKAKFCGGCGARAGRDTQKFCTECGFKLC